MIQKAPKEDDQAMQTKATIPLEEVKLPDASGGDTMGFVFRLEGLSPLIVHNPLSMSASPSESLTAGAKRPTPEEEAKASLYVYEGRYVFPAAGVRGAFLNGGKRFKMPLPGSRRMVAASYFLATIGTRDEWLTILDPTTGEPVRDYAIDQRRVVVQEASIVRARAKFWPWAVDVVFEADRVTWSLPYPFTEESGEKDRQRVTRVADILRQCLSLGGQYEGLGEFRPQHRGQFGRFRVASVRVEVDG
jgi:hypothetical protein